jgi:hypothetical protein
MEAFHRTENRGQDWDQTLFFEILNGGLRLARGQELRASALASTVKERLITPLFRSSFAA